MRRSVQRTSACNDSLAGLYLGVKLCLRVLIQGRDAEV